MNKPLHKVPLKSDVKDLVDLRVSDSHYIIKIKREDVAYINILQNEHNDLEAYVKMKGGKSNE